MGLSTRPGGYYNYSQECDPYYQDYNKENQQKILQLMIVKNVTSVWLYMSRVYLKQWTWFNGEKYGNDCC